MATFRRKIKRFLLLAFFATLVVKIHNDYQLLNAVNEKGLSSMAFNFNDTGHVNIIRLNAIKDIINYREFNVNQRKLSILNLSSSSPHLLPPDVTFKEILKNAENIEEKKREIHKGNVEEEKPSQIVPSVQDQGTNNDSRIAYNPSFRKKMEEAFREKMESYKLKQNTNKMMNDMNEWDRNGRPPPTEIKANQNSAINNVNRAPQESKHENLKINSTQMLKRLQSLKKRAVSSKHPVKPKKALPFKFKLSHVVDSAEISLTRDQIEKIKTEINIINEEQLIYNKDKFGPLTDNDTVILIQVHNRLENLKYLVESLGQVKYINSSLVMFSHDLWNEDTNSFVRSIKDFRVMQIFFPFSIQLNPATFPGRDPRDCVWDQKDKKSPLAKGETLSCLNKKWPDSYGHYREAAFTQIKHHWWWKLVRVFDHLREVQKFKGQVLFLEEDHFVVPDLLHTLRLLVKDRNKSYKSHLIFGLGNYLKQTSTASNSVERGDWVVNKYNLGFAFDRRAFDIIKKCQKDFCHYDDYNWDWSLAHMANTCAKSQFSMLNLKLSRVLHIGSCGTHVRKQGCNLAKEVNIAKARMKSFKSRLFPSSLNINLKFKGAIKSKKSNGGWGDFRDRQLCVAIINGTDVNTTLKNLQFERGT